MNNRKTLHALLLISLFVALTGCTMTLPVSGRFNNGGAAFVGTATGHIDGSGTLNLKGDNGLTVTGNFVYVTSREGRGTFKACDGRSGSFTFVSTGQKGTGTGYLGGEEVSFTFGTKTDREAAQASLKNK